MNAPRPIVLVGAGAHGLSAYARRAIPRLQALGKARAVGVVEPDEERRRAATDALQLREKDGFPTLGEALSVARDGIVIVCTPPASHEALVFTALTAGWDVFCEKPLADTLESCCRIERTCAQSGRRLAVNMSWRFDEAKQAFVRHLRAGTIGEVEYLFTRLSWDHAAAAKGRVDAPDAYLMEGGVHALDFLRDAAGSNVRRVFNLTWPVRRPPFRGNSNAVVSMEMANGVRAVLEGSWTAPATTHPWGLEHVRADGSEAALELDHRRLRRLAGAVTKPNGLQERLLAQFGPGLDGTDFLLEAFCDWVDGRRDDHPTAVADNLHGMALLFAAIESGRTGAAVDVPAFLEAARARA